MGFNKFVKSSSTYIVYRNMKISYIHTIMKLGTMIKQHLRTSSQRLSFVLSGKRIEKELSRDIWV